MVDCAPRPTATKDDLSFQLEGGIAYFATVLPASNGRFIRARAKRRISEIGGLYPQGQAQPGGNAKTIKATIQTVEN